MQVSLHRRRQQTERPRRRGSSRLVLVFLVLTLATVAWALSGGWSDDEPSRLSLSATTGTSASSEREADEPSNARPPAERAENLARAAERDSRAVVDERVRAHLRRLR